MSNYRETPVEPQGDIESLRWPEPPTTDSLGSPVDHTHAFRVRTTAELARVVEWSRENHMLLRPAGSLTSSKAFVAPKAAFMAHYGKRGVALVGFDPSAEFGQIHVDLDREEVTVGAAVSLDQMSEAVRRESYDPDLGRARLKNLMTITTMDASAVATALGSGGVSDAAESSISLMTGSRWLDGRGHLHSENYKTSGYFGAASSSFARVRPDQVGREMSGRGSPFGIGVSTRFKLAHAPVASRSFIYPFYGEVGKVRDDLSAFITHMNGVDRRLRSENAQIGLQALELMDVNAMRVARRAMNWAPNFNGHGDPSMIVIAEFDQYDFFDDGKVAWEKDDFVEKALEHDLVPGAFYETVQAYDGSPEQLTRFRLQGPEHIRHDFKAAKRDHPMAATESTDWAVDAADPALVNWYLGHFFRLHDGVQKHTYGQALYGHLLRRLDLHHRVIVLDPGAFQAHVARTTTFGYEVGDRQKAGDKVRVRGEKVELTSGRDLKTIGMKREGPHRDANVELLTRLDPDGIRIEQAPERWGGQYDWK